MDGTQGGCRWPRRRRPPRSRWTRGPSRADLRHRTASNRRSATPGSSRWPAARSSRRWGASAAAPSRSSTPSSTGRARLCRADVAQLYLLDGDVFRLSRIVRRGPRGVPPVHAASHPMQPDRATCSGGSRWTGAPSRSTTSWPTRSTAGGTSSAWPASAPCCRRRCCSVTRWSASSRCGGRQVAPFSERDMGLLDEFAAQAAIALRQVDLMQSLESRSAELASKVEQLEALRERRRGGQLEPRPRRGAEQHRQQRRPAHRHRRRLDHGVRRADGRLRRSGRRTAAARTCSNRLREITIRRDATLVGRAATERRPLEVPTSPRCRSTRTWRSSTADGWRSMLAVPMLRGDLDRRRAS